MGIPAADVRDWADRLASAAPNPEGRRAPESDRVDVPDWLERSRIVLRGARGLEELSNFGVTTAPVPDEFEASLLRVSVGEVMLFSTLETAHVVTYGGLADGPDIVIIGRESAGLQRLHRTATTSVEEMGVGRMGFMSSFAPSVVEHVGVTETTGVVLPTDLLGPVRDRLSGGVGLLPDTALTRAAGIFFAGALHDLLVRGATGDGALESAVVALARTALAQTNGTADDLAATMRTAAMDVIERRYPDPAFDAVQLADELHVSRRQLYRYFAIGARTVHESILGRRLAAARGLILSAPHRDLESIARECGFVDAAAMRTRFNRAFGTSPAAFRRAAVDGVPLPGAMLLTAEQAAAGRHQPVA